MLVGVVRYAPTLPVSIEAPFLQLEQKFMHLGFYVYDLTMHAPGSEGRVGIVAAASLLLVSVIVSLNIVALLLRVIDCVTVCVIAAVLLCLLYVVASCFA